MYLITAITAGASFVLCLVVWVLRFEGRAVLSDSQRHNRPQVLLLITTQFSPSHQRFLQNCWPAALASSRLLREADVLVVSTGGRNSSFHEGLIREVFAEYVKTNITLVSYNNPGYQEGAILAFDEGLANGWFNGYDWVVRLNPDVIIKNDSWLVTKMSERDVHGIFVDCKDTGCQQQCLAALIHTDFFAFRPNKVDAAAIKNHSNITNAEYKATAFFHQIVVHGADRWVPGTRQGSSCRVRGAASPIIHDHSFVESCRDGS